MSPSMHAATRTVPLRQPLPPQVSRVDFDAGLLARLARSGPRYTSYPTADRFSDGFGYRDYLHAVADLRTRGSSRPLSLYLHIPFCDTVCYYC